MADGNSCELFSAWVTTLVVAMLIRVAGFELSNGITVLLTPGPKAFVKEGKTLDLQCNWTGSSNFSYVNWYLNDDIQGLVIDASGCNYTTTPIIYEIDRYSTTCSSIRFTLSIANISKVKDDGDKWECDITIFGMHPPSKALTVITVIEDDIMDGNGGENGEPVKELKVVFGVLGVFGVVAVGLYLICRRRKTDCITGQGVGGDTESPLNNKLDQEEVYKQESDVD